MYSDEWMKEGYIRDGRVHISGPVSLSYARDKKGRILGVIVDFETADDFHYELLIDDWKLFCHKYLGGEDGPVAFRTFIEEKGTDTIKGLFAFEFALEEAGIEYKKIAFYDFGFD